jgi:glycerate kinase
MNIVVAPDSFKESLTSIQASHIIKKAIMDVDENAYVVMKPMADGGGGTLETLLTSTNGVNVPITCTGPLGERINTTYGIVDGHTAIIECASVAGLMQVSRSKRNPDLTTSYGIGEVILDALEKGCTSFVIGLGGSATNDGGLGMLLALGMKAWDEKGGAIGCYGIDMHQVKKISFSSIDKRLKHANIKVACDVDNPLCGIKGASFTYGPQKGATNEQVKRYDLALNNFGDIVESEIDQSLKEVPGAGAAGGLGFAFLAIDGTLVSGAELLADTMEIEKSIMKADLVITGEGKSDEQTLYGKAPGYLAALANKYNVPVILISGSLHGDLDKLKEVFSGCFSIINQPLSLEACIEQAEKLLYEQTKQVIHFIGEIKKG